MKKFLLFNVMLACTCTMTLSAAGPFQTFKIITQESGKSARIVGVAEGVVLEGDVEIPSSVTKDGVKYTVKGIGYDHIISDHHHPDDTQSGIPVFYNQKKMTSIYIPSTITYIADNAFVGCTGLTRFRVSSENKTYKVIDDVLYTWSGDWLWLLHYPAAKEGSSFTVPEPTTMIEPWAFASARYLTTLYIYPCYRSLSPGWSLGNNTISSFRHVANTHYTESYKIINGMLITANDDENVELLAVPPLKQYELLNIPSEVTKIQDLALANSRIKAVAIPSSVKSIGNEAFLHSTINTISIPSTVTEIGYGMFRECRSLTTATVNANVTNLPEWTFEGCTALTSAKLGSAITNIFPLAYNGCSSLKSYSLNGIKSMEYSHYGEKLPSYGIFQNCGLESINWPSGVTTIPSDTFWECENLKSITIKDETRIIEDLAFYGTAIETFNTMNLTEIHRNAFANCDKLRKVVIADSPNKLLLAKGAFFLGFYGSNTQLYINHKNIGLLPLYGDDKDWGQAFQRWGSYTCYSSRLTPQYFPTDWSVLYVPARVSKHYDTNFNGENGEIYEMFTYEPDFGHKRVRISPNYSWVKITAVNFDGRDAKASTDQTVWTCSGITDTPKEVTLDYTVNGVKMTTTYTAKYNSAAIGDTEMDDDDAAPVYYDLHGSKVNNPTQGIYIRVQGAKREKIIL